jgi:hypothetical protein
MIWTILICAGGIFAGSLVIGQVYAWITDRPNPVWNVFGGCLEGVGDIIGDMADGFGGDGGGDCGGGD